MVFPNSLELPASPPTKSFAPILPNSLAPRRGPPTAPFVLPAMPQTTMQPQPTMQPAMQPTMQPAMQPTMQPAMQPTIQPAMQPTLQPTMSTGLLAEDRVGASPLLPLSSGDELRTVMSTLPPLTAPADEPLPTELPSDANSCSPLANQPSPSSRHSRADSATRRVHSESMDMMNFLPLAKPEARAGVPRSARTLRGAARDSQVLVHFVGVQEPFGVVAVDTRSDKLDFVRKMIEKHFSDVTRGQPFLFVSRDGVTIRRSQEKELVAWNQAFEKVGSLWGCEE